ncbi:MAG TPA: outer membrane beta-barrel protein [Pseudolabrys sp.]|nr:outer membrane beta-barrel protein [Pseudolabrys sp.]
MTRLIRIVSFWFVALAMTAPSFAADLRSPIYKAPPLPAYVPYNWSGIYVGANGGYGWGKAHVTNGLADFTTNSQYGWLAGVTVGYNMQTGVWVWGLEGDIDYAFIKGNGSNVATCGISDCEVKNTWVATARGRVGYAMDRWMPYVTGGAAFAGAKISTGTGSNTRTTTGWTVGGGVEYGISRDWSVKAEYLYADLGKATCDAGVCGIETTFRPRINMVRAGVNVRF